jgi:hypothetical protein
VLDVLDAHVRMRRQAGDGRPLSPIGFIGVYKMASLPELPREVLKVGHRFWRNALNLVGLARDVLRIGQAEVGPPMIWDGTVEVAAQTNQTYPFPTPKDGLVRSFCVHLEREDDVLAQPLAVVESVAVASHEYYLNVGGNALVSSPINAALGIPAAVDGFLRRFPVRNDSTWQVRIANPSDVVHRFVIRVEMYDIPSSVAERLDRGYYA